jgi:hypothetical protein
MEIETVGDVVFDLPGPVDPRWLSVALLAELPDGLEGRTLRYPGDDRLLRALTEDEFLLVWLRPDLAFRIPADPTEPSRSSYDPDGQAAWLDEIGIPPPPWGFAWFVECPEGWTSHRAWSRSVNAGIRDTGTVGPEASLAVISALLDGTLTPAHR